VRLSGYTLIYFDIPSLRLPCSRELSERPYRTCLVIARMR